MGWIEGSQVKWLVVVTALVAAGACSGGADDASNDVSDGSSPSPGPSGPVIEGSIIGDTFHPGYTVELADDWSTLDGAFMVKEDAGTALGMSVWDVKTVPGHPCRWRGTERDVGSTVDELVQALVSQRLRNPTEPVPITLAGYEGAYLRAVGAKWTRSSRPTPSSEAATRTTTVTATSCRGGGRVAASATSRPPARSTGCGSSTSTARRSSSTRRTRPILPPPTEPSSSRSSGRSDSSTRRRSRQFPRSVSCGCGGIEAPRVGGGRSRRAAKHRRSRRHVERVGSSAAFMRKERRRRGSRGCGNGCSRGRSRPAPDGLRDRGALKRRPRQPSTQPPWIKGFAVATMCPDDGRGSQLARTVTHMPSEVTLTPVGKCGIVMRVTSLRIRVDSPQGAVSGRRCPDRTQARCDVPDACGWVAHWQGERCGLA